MSLRVFSGSFSLAVKLSQPLSSPLVNTLAAEQQKILACVHCGLCLEACPTYVLTGNENDSPRGRIYLMKAVEEGRLAASSPAFRIHIDRCLGCRACEPVCPAGVDYGHLLEASRAELFSQSHVPSNEDIRTQYVGSYRLLRFILKHVWIHPPRLRLAFAFARFLRDTRVTAILLKSKVARLFSRRVEFGLALLESSRATKFVSLDQRAPRALPTAAQISSEKTIYSDRKSASLFLGCVGEGLFTRVNAATARVLKANGFQFTTPSAQVCCGALHAHAGDLEGARTLARQNIEAFDASPNAPIVTNAGGCGAMLLTYEHLLAGDEPFRDRARNFSGRIRDVSQLLEDIELKQGAELNGEATTYDASCHLLNVQHAGDAPLKVLKGIPNLEYVPLAGADRCCGAAGVYNLLEPDMSRRVLNDKISNVRACGAAVLATGNAGCQMQIGAGAKLEGLQLRVCHPVELLDESYARAGYYESGS